MSEPCIVVENVGKRYGSVVAVDGVSFSVARGARHAVIGPNGAGKSTLFAMLAGTIRPSSGRVRLLGEDITKLPDHERARRGMAKTFQHSSLFPSMTLLENVLLGAERRHGRASRPFGRHSMSATHQAERALDRVGLSSRAHTKVASLSHGERRQLEVAMAFAVEPKVLLFDEPTAGMSAAETSRFVEMIQLVPSDITVLIIEHDLDVVFSIADRVTVLHLGAVLADGSATEVRSSEIVQQTYLGGSPFEPDPIRHATEVGSA